MRRKRTKRRLQETRQNLVKRSEWRMSPQCIIAWWLKHPKDIHSLRTALQITAVVDVNDSVTIWLWHTVLVVLMVLQKMFDALYLCDL